jgi:hypothetical protein
LFRYTEKYLTIFVVRNKYFNTHITGSLKVTNGIAAEFVKPTEWLPKLFIFIAFRLPRLERFEIFAIQKLKKKNLLVLEITATKK